MKVLCVFGQHQYGDPARGLGTEYAAFIPALRNLGHEVAHFESWNKRLYRDLADLNRKLLDAVASFDPDVVLTVHMEYEIWLETLEAIRSRSNAATISWATDDSWKYREVSRFVGSAYHAMATTYDYVVSRYHADGIKEVILTQWAVPSDWLSEPLPAADCRYQVSFVGSVHGDRKKMMAKLHYAGIEVVCFGQGWPNGPVSMDQIPRIMRESVISLNFSNSRGDNQVKARTFEIPGSGGFLLTGPAPGLERFYLAGIEVAVFHGVDDLVQKIRHYLARPDERNAVARAGHERTLRDHTYEQRMAELLEFALNARARSGPLPTAIPFEEALAAYRLSPTLTMFRCIVLAGCRMLFGSAKGTRAARRLVFELSWRLAGRQTFTAAGWPGRLFPHL